MSDWLLAMLFFWTVFNAPVFVRLLPERGGSPVDGATLRRWVPGFGLALLVLVLVALLSGSILDLLGLSGSTFQIATGALVVFGALQAFLAIGVHVERVSPVWSNVTLFIWMVSPAPVALAIALSAEESAGFAVGALLAAAGIAVALALLWIHWRGQSNRAILGWLRRLFAAAAVVAAINLIRQGVENV